MGKRKSSSKPQGPKKSVAVKLDKKVGIGYLECKVCGQKFQCGINYLSAAVDVYGEWVDAADAVAEERVEGEGSHSKYSQPEPSRLSSSRPGASSRDVDEDDYD